MIRFETGISIARPPRQVFTVVADPETYPRWNSAVQRVHREADTDQGRYVMERQLPSGPATNLLEVVSTRPPEEVVIRASEGPTPFTYRYRLREANGGTDLSVEAEVELGVLAGMLGPLAGRVVKHGVDENLVTLKRLLEHSS